MIEETRAMVMLCCVEMSSLVKDLVSSLDLKVVVFVNIQIDFVKQDSDYELIVMYWLVLTINNLYYYFVDICHLFDSRFASNLVEHVSTRTKDRSRDLLLGIYFFVDVVSVVAVVVFVV